MGFADLDASLEKFHTFFYVGHPVFRRSRMHVVVRPWAGCCLDAIVVQERVVVPTRTRRGHPGARG